MTAETLERWMVVAGYVVAEGVTVSFRLDVRGGGRMPLTLGEAVGKIGELTMDELKATEAAGDVRAY